MFRKVIISFFFITILSFVSVVHGQLVAHWTFDDVVGSTVPDSARDHVGTIYGDVNIVDSNAPIPFGSSQAASFPGDGNDYIDFSETVYLSPRLEPFTFSGWIKFNDVTNRQNLYANRSQSSLGVIMIFMEGGELYTYLHDNITSANHTHSTSNVQLSVNKWYHIVVVRDGYNIKTYVNGEKKAESTATDVNDLNVLFGDAPLLGKHFQETHWLNGIVDNIRLYDHALNMSEIEQLYAGKRAYGPTPEDNAANATQNSSLTWLPGISVASHDIYFGTDYNSVYNIGEPGNKTPTCELEFNETSGTTANDSQGSSDGTLINFPGDNSQWVDDSERGQCLEFGGVNDYMILADGNSLSPGTGGFMFSGWFKFNNVISRQNLYGDKGMGLGYINIHQEDGEIYVYMRDVDGDCHNFSTSGASIQDNTWCNITVVRNDDNVKVFVDGMKKGESDNQSLHSVGVTGGVVPQIGRHPDDAHYFSGRVDDVRVYIGSNVLDASLYKDNQAGTSYSVTSLTPGTTYYWRIDEVNDANIWKGDVWNFSTAADFYLTGKWNFNEVSGMTVDDSEDNVNGTLCANFSTPACWVEDIYFGFMGVSYLNRCLQFDGSDDYVSFSSGNILSPGNGNWTLSGWFKFNETSRKQVIYSDGGAGNGSVVIHLENGAIYTYMLDTNSKEVNFRTENADILTGQWYHIAIVRDGNNVITYVNADGNTSDSVQGFGNIDTINSSSPQIGRHYVDAQYFNGYVDEVRIYSRALSGNDIQGIYKKQLTGSEFVIKNWWEFNETSGTTTNDSQGSSDGTLINFPDDNSQWVNDSERGQCLEFDGSNDYVTLANGNSLSPGTGGFMFSGWFKFDDFTDRQNLYSDKGTGLGCIIIHQEDGEIYVYMRDVDGDYHDFSTNGANIRDSKWYNITVIRNDDNIKTFVDGMKKGESNNQSLHSVGVTGGVAPQIGRHPDVAHYFSGRVDDVAIIMP